MTRGARCRISTFAARTRCGLPLALHSFSGPDDEVYGAADEVERFAELVLEVAAIGEVQRLVGVGEERDRGGLRAELRGVVEAARAAAHGGRVVLAQGALEDGVELGRADALAVGGGDLVDAREELLHAAAGLRGDELDRRVGE